MNHLVKLLFIISIMFACVSPDMSQTNATGGRGVVLNDVPREIDKNARYLIYISGFIVEAGNTRPTSPKFGVYEYDQILEAFRQRGFIVISEARKQSNDIAPYAKKVAVKIKLLLNAGVPPQHITVVGASQGAWIGMLVSTYLENRSLNFVIIGACGADDGFLKSIDLHGNILFIAERTERFRIAGCQRFRDDATGIGEFQMMETNTGQEHGFLFRPMKEWIDPTIEWARRR